MFLSLFVGLDVPLGRTLPKPPAASSLLRNMNLWCCHAYYAFSEGVQVILFILSFYHVARLGPFLWDILS